MLKKTGSLVYAAAGGIFGVTAGCIVAVVYLRIQFGKSNQILQQGGGVLGVAVLDLQYHSGAGIHGADGAALRDAAVNF